MKRWQKMFLVPVVFVGALYLGRGNIVRAIDAYFYEPVLAACVSVTGFWSSDRLQIELQSFCNVSMIMIVTEAEES